MEIRSINAMRGPNYWSVRRHKLIVMVLDLQEMEEKPSNKIDGFYERLKAMFPTMYEHRCSVGEPGGFFQRVEEGTWMNLDVSPDGQTIVFDLLGDIYTMPITGGTAKPIRTGIAWEIQPRFSPDGQMIAEQGFWSGWTPATWIPIITNSMGGIIVGLVTKYAGSVRKGFALIFGILARAARQPGNQ